MDVIEFRIGQRVRKVRGGYHAMGIIMALFRADDGSMQYVFRFDIPAGLTHIFSADELEAA